MANDLYYNKQIKKHKIMKYYFYTMLAILGYRIIRILLFWIMSNKSAKRVSTSLNLSDKMINTSEILKGMNNIKNKGNPNNQP